jgi:L-2,4-diaminobutyric acid acetyltransferase
MSDDDDITLRAALPDDARRVWGLIEEVGTLERNSCYAYVLLCSHFASTCVIAERAGQILGFLLAYRPPADAASVFVWQVGVAPRARGRRLAARMLDALVARPSCRDARFLTATVTADNASSLALFQGFARARAVACRRELGFPSALFAETHADELLLRIGPLKGNT